jgi:hypothetical protein
VCQTLTHPQLADHARSKPTGNAEKSAWLDEILDVEADLDEKVALAEIQDRDDSDDDVVEVEDSSEEEKPLKTSKKKAQKTGLVKSYKLELGEKPVRQPRRPGPTDILQSLSSSFSAESMRERDNSRFTQQMGLSQVAALTSQLQQSQAEALELRERLTDARIKISSLETRLEMSRGPSLHHQPYPPGVNYFDPGLGDFEDNYRPHSRSPATWQDHTPRRPQNLPNQYRYRHEPTSSSHRNYYQEHHHRASRSRSPHSRYRQRSSSHSPSTRARPVNATYQPFSSPPVASSSAVRLDSGVPSSTGLEPTSITLSLTPTRDGKLMFDVSPKK